jgi:hypothetical protein
MPSVVPGAPPQGGPLGATPKKGMPGWAWALIGGGVALALAGGLFGAFMLGKQANQNTAVEATSTASLEASASPTSTVEATEAAALASSTAGDSSSSGDSADSGTSSESGSSGSSGDSGSSSDSGSGSSASSDSGDSSSSDSDSSSSDTAEPVYHSVLKLNGNSDYTSAPIRLDPGHMKLTVVVTRTNHRPLSVRYRKNSGSYTTWWATPNAVVGQSRTTEIDVSARALYQYRVNCEPGAAWSLRVMWKP